MKDHSLEVVLPEASTISDLSSHLLLPGMLHGLWPAMAGAEASTTRTTGQAVGQAGTPGPLGGITVKEVVEYFAGGKMVKVQKEGYEEPITIPKAERSVVEAAIGAAVEAGKLWLVSGMASILDESIPAGILTDMAHLLPPPSPILTTDVLPENLPEVWQGQETTALGISVALSHKAGKTLPWVTVREAIDGAIRSRMLETTVDSGPWPCDLSGAQTVKVRVPTEKVELPLKPPPLRPGVRVGEAELRPNEIQDLADVMGDLVSATVGHNLKFRLRIELGGNTPPPDEVVEKVNKVLKDVSKDIRLR